MTLVDTLVAVPPPLRVGEHGVVRIGRTRVTLDSVIYAFERGATAEEIAQSYPSLQLADVYAVISYYLNHRSEVQEYLAEQEKRAQEIRKEIEAHFPPQDWRERLLARRNKNQ